MRTTLLVLTLFSSGLAFGAEPTFDSQLAVDLARSQLQAYFRSEPKRDPGALDWYAPVVMSVQDGSDREFVLVAFRRHASDIGATIVFEVCGSKIDLAASTYGASSNISHEMAWFKSMSGNPTADYPHACSDSD